MFFKVLQLTFLLICLYACSNSKDKDEIIVRPVVTSKIIKSANYETQRVFSGAAVANTKIDVSFRIPGMIEEMDFKVGQLIADGQRLAKLESHDYELNLISSIAKLKSAEAQRVNYINEYERIKRLYEQDSASKKDLDIARSAFNVSESNVKIASSDLEIAKNKLSYSVIYFNCEEYGTCNEKCFISKKNFELGENVSAKQDVFSIDCLEKIEVEVFVPDNFINSVKQDTEVFVFFPTIGEEERFLAKVKEIEPTSASQSNLYKVTFALLEQRDNLRPGMNAEVYFITKDNDDSGYYVPQEAIAGEPDGTFIYLFENTDSEFGIAKKAPVTVVKRAGNLVKVIGDIDYTKDVIIAGLRYIKDNMQIKKEQKIFIESLEVGK